MLCDSGDRLLQPLQHQRLQQWGSTYQAHTWPHLGQLEKYYEVLSLEKAQALSGIVRLDFQVVQLMKFPHSKWSISFCCRVSFILAVASATVTSHLNTSCLSPTWSTLARTETSARSWTLLSRCGWYAWPMRITIFDLCQRHFYTISDILSALLKKNTSSQSLTPGWTLLPTIAPGSSTLLTDGLGLLGLGMEKIKGHQQQVNNHT